MILRSLIDFIQREGGKKALMNDLSQCYNVAADWTRQNKIGSLIGLASKSSGANQSKGDEDGLPDVGHHWKTGSMHTGVGGKLNSRSNVPINPV
jgi:hypothetical protein